MRFHSRFTRLLTGLALVIGASGSAAESAPDKRTIKVKAPAPIKYKYNSSLGLGIAQGSSLVVGGQLGFPVSVEFPAFAGPEISFALYSPGALYAVMGTFWYEISLDRTTKSVLSLGTAVGMVSTMKMTKFPALTYAAFLDVAMSQEVDEDVLVRGQLRPGTIGSRFAFWMNMNVTFLFR
jgi:hypothetical protein